MQECWNWQTGQTKDLVVAKSCGFKSHLLQEKNEVDRKSLLRFLVSQT